MRHRYHIYGIPLESDVPLPELPVDRSRRVPSLRIDRAPDGAVSFAALGDEDVAYRRHGDPAGGDADRVVLTVRGLGRYEIEPTRIRIFAVPGAPAERLRHFLVCQALGIVLHMRGAYVLHASAVDTPGGVVAFAGPCGAGKSTLAAVGARLGHGIASDDITAIHLTDAGPVVLPGLSRLRLLEDAAQWFGPAGAAALAVGGDAKRAVLARAAERPRPLARIVVMDRTRPPGVVRGSAALLELAGHTYGARLLDHAAARARHFGQLERIVSSVPIERHRPRRGARAIERFAAAVLAGGSPGS